MSERIAENQVTRINYNPSLKMIFPMIVGMVISNIETESLAQQLFGKRLYSSLGIGAGWVNFETEVPGSSADIILIRKHPLATLARGLFFSSLIQIPLILEGSFDPEFYPLFAVGAAGGWAVDKTAKALYNSGFTEPIYRLLRIQDRRLKLPV